jgi:hypothetical protein
MPISMLVIASIMVLFVTCWISYYFGGVLAESSNLKHRIGPRAYLVYAGSIATLALLAIGWALDSLYQVPVAACLVQPIWLSCLAGGLIGTFQLYMPLRNNNSGSVSPVASRRWNGLQ